MIPIGLNLTCMGVSSAWWLESARQAEQAGFRGVWCWDHSISRGKKTTPVLECWTTLTAAAAVTRKLRVGSFIDNVMNRQPAILARMLATLSEQSGGRVELGIGVGGNEEEALAYGIPFPAPPERVELGIGVGGNEEEALAYGIPFPDPAERVEILEEAVAVMRLLWTGGPVDFSGRHFQLREAWSYPVPEPAPRVIVGGEKPAGARLAARLGDGWTTNAPDYEALLPVHLEELAAHGRSRAQVAHLIAVSIDKDVPLERQPLIADMATFLGEWQERGADEIIVSWVRPTHLPALLEAAARAGLG